ncbi:hypothetical protein BD309DRAFT_874578 [Dichomitus squalens]|uniref:BTB domain-containing protein n=1 Tax=Dichomitus squalens TaxID=114155 RepID=A0A4Q9PN77_9APHY|nr:hypothetical protein BD309DRAFT_874578 [Dichomitus squalens]TBU55722.1 hypothetical protein BD310DRAFT_950627 [Dichomitus squalens]
MLYNDGEFWLGDGTVILVAGTIEFRVYKGLLAAYSPVLKDLFARKHPFRDVPSGDRHDIPCPVVRVSDSPDDLRHLLRVCIAGRMRSLYDAREPSFHEISACIRLGEKYQIAELVSQSLHVLRRHFPSDFDVWYKQPSWMPPNWDDVQALGVVNLARLTGESSLLPAAFIACIWAGSAVVHGLVREDGSRETLSPDDLAVCFDATSRIHEATVGVILRTFHPTPCKECATRKVCRTALRDALLSLEGHVRVLTNSDPFMPQAQFLPEGHVLGVCAQCASMVRERKWKERRGVWGKLPELLGIEVPGWIQPILELPPSPPKGEEAA